MKNCELREREMDCHSLRALERYKKVFVLFFCKNDKKCNFKLALPQKRLYFTLMQKEKSL